MLYLSSGSLYLQKLQLKRDYYEAARWYRKSADQNKDNAQYNLGLMYYHGAELKQDKAQAFLTKIGEKW